MQEVLGHASTEVIDAAKEGKWVRSSGCASTAHARSGSSVQDKTFELLEACKNPDQVVNCRPSVRQYGVLHQAAFHGDIEVRLQMGSWMYCKLLSTCEQCKLIRRRMRFLSDLLGRS